jgi:hypothetical protein
MKKILFSFLTFSFVLSSAMVGAPVLADSQVCGVDNVTYGSAAAAEAAGVDVSYEFACATVTSEANLYESKKDINFVGQLIEIGSTDLPTNIIVRSNKDQADHTVSVTSSTILGQRRDQATNLADWIPGDQIRVIGKKNENNDTVEATILANLSIVIVSNRGANGWITSISSSTQEIKYKWRDKEYTFNYDSNTRFVVAGKNPATVDDLKVGDRIRARLLLRSGQNPLAKIVVVLRRGNDLFMKIRTFKPHATLVRLDSTIVPTTIQVRMDKTPGLRANDVNNTIGSEGALITVNVTEDTKIVRKYFGRTTLDEFSIGDKLIIVGRVNDDGTVDAKVIKNNSIWKTSTQGHAGVVTAVDIPSNTLTMNWVPVKHITKKKLKEKLSAESQTVTAQSTDDPAIITDSNTTPEKSLREALKAKIERIAVKKIGKFNREVKYKKVKIDRIKHEGAKIKDLVHRLPAKKITVVVNSNTKIVVGTNSNATLADIQVGDKVRIRGTLSITNKTLTADTIVVVNSLPEIEESLETPIDDVNEVVSEIITGDTSDNAIVSDTTSATETEVVNSAEGSATTTNSTEDTTSDESANTNQ